MRQYLFLIFILFSFGGSVFAANFGGIMLSTDKIESNIKDNSNFVSTGDAIKKLEARQLDILSTLKIEKAQTSELVRQKNDLTSIVDRIDQLFGDWTNLNNEKIGISAHLEKSDVDEERMRAISVELASREQDISESIIQLSELLDFGPFSENTAFSELQKEFPTMKKMSENVLNGYDISIAEFEKKKNELLVQNKTELDAINMEIERLKQVRREQAIHTAKQIGGYLLIFVGIYLAKIITKRLVVRFGRRFSKPHQEAIKLFHRWIFHILFIGSFLVLFAAEFLSFLPFFAIIGTAIGLALRDAIYSFIGWFAVGSDSGYQEGDFIEFETTQGRVYKITPLLTNIEEYGSQGFTGKIISFPNKTIFEKNIKNWSRGTDFSLMTVDFLLTHQSDIQRAKDILLGIVSANKMTVYYQTRKELATFRSMYGYTEDDLTPKIHIMNEPRGIIVRIRILVHVQDRLQEQSRIMESFSAAIQNEKHVAFRSV